MKLEEKESAESMKMDQEQKQQGGFREIYSRVILGLHDDVYLSTNGRSSYSFNAAFQVENIIWLPLSMYARTPRSRCNLP